MILPPGGETAFVPNTSTNTLAAIHLESGKTKLIPTDKRPQGAVRSHDGKFPYLTNSEGNSITMIDIAKQENIGRIPTGAGPNRIALTPDGKTLVYQNLFCAPIGSSAIALTPAGKTLVYSMQTGESVGVRRHRFPQANRGSEAAGTAVVVHPHVCD